MFSQVHSLHTDEEQVLNPLQRLPQSIRVMQYEYKREINAITGLTIPNEKKKKKKKHMTINVMKATADADLVKFHNSVG